MYNLKLEKDMYSDQEMLDELRRIYRKLKDSQDDGMKLMHERMMHFMVRADDS